MRRLWLFWVVVILSVTACASNEQTAVPTAIVATVSPMIEVLVSPTIETLVLPTEAVTIEPTQSVLPDASREVSVWALYPEQLTIRQNADVIDEVNYVWYRLVGNGKLTGSNASPSFVKELQAMNIRVMPAIQNSGFNPDYVTYVVANEEIRKQHAQDIVQLVEKEGYDGIDIDYESLHAEDRDNFSLFIEELATALHEKDKLLSVTVHPKTDDLAGWEGPNAQDWARLGAAADMFKIMVYDWTSADGSPGPVAPIPWADQVLAYAATRVPPEKTYLGLPFYGYDYGPVKKQSVTWSGAQSLLQQYGAAVERDESNEAMFTYELGGVHTVFYNDAVATETKIQEMFNRHPKLKGVAIWVIGGEDPGNWLVLRQNFVK